MTTEGWKREKDGVWVDHVSPDGNWKATEGEDEWARRKEGKPWTLLERTPRATKSGWTDRGQFKSLIAAKRHAEKLLAERKTEKRP